MGMLDQARADLRQIVNDVNGFSVLATFTSKTDVVKSTRVLHSKHHIGVDNEGRKVNSKNGHVSFTEADMTDYPVRNLAGEVGMKGDRVSVADSTGVVKQYKLTECWPNETLGIIVCALGDLE